MGGELFGKEVEGRQRAVVLNVGQVLRGQGTEVGRIWNAIRVRQQRTAGASTVLRVDR